MERDKFPGHNKTWLIAFILVLVAYYYAYFLMLSAGTSEMEKLFGLVYWFCLNYFPSQRLGFRYL